MLFLSHFGVDPKHSLLDIDIRSNPTARFASGMLLHFWRLAGFICPVFHFFNDIFSAEIGFGFEVQQFDDFFRFSEGSRS